MYAELWHIPRPRRHWVTSSICSFDIDRHQKWQRPIRAQEVIQNRREIRIVASFHLQSDYIDRWDRCLITTGTSFWFILLISFWLYWKPILRLYNHVLHILRIIQHSQGSRVEDVCLHRWNRNNIGPMQMTSARLEETVANASLISRERICDPQNKIPLKWHSGSCRSGQIGTTSKPSKGYLVRTARNGLWHQVNESCIAV